MRNFDPVDVLPEKYLAQEQRLRSTFDVVEHDVTIGDRCFHLLHPRSADDLIDDAAFNRDERLPYWAEIWPSANVLAQRITEENGAAGGRARRLLELGCGSGLVVLAASAAGFQVTAVDYYSEALEFVRLNALRNRLPLPETRVVDWRNYPADLVNFDFVVAADVLYETGYCRLVAEAFGKSLSAEGSGVLTDPQRAKAAALPEECRKAGLAISTPRVFGPLSVPGGDPTVRQTVNLFEIRRSQ